MNIKLSWQSAEKLINKNTNDKGYQDLCPEPLVSISLVTYQHAKFVEQSLDSILEQETNFSFEIIIGDDGSTDGTLDILQRYQKKHPDKIRLLISQPNLGQYTGNGRLNLIRNLRACRGKYIALLEGDDYWIENTKLQQQVEFLEANSDYAGYCGNAIIRWEDGRKHPEELYNKQSQQDPLPLSKMVTRYVAQTASYCMRGVPDWVYSDWFVNLDAADNAFLWGMAMQGKVKYNHQPWSVWRRQHGTGTSIVGANFFRHFSHRFEILIRFEAIYEVSLEAEKKILFKSAVSSEIIRHPKVAFRRLLGMMYRKIRNCFRKKR